MTTSQTVTKFFKCSTSFLFLKSAVIERLFRFIEAKFSLKTSPAVPAVSGGQARNPSPTTGLSTLTTSAPKSASKDPTNGPAAI